MKLFGNFNKPVRKKNLKTKDNKDKDINLILPQISILYTRCLYNSSIVNLNNKYSKYVRIIK